MLPQRPTDHFVLSMWLGCGLGLASCSDDVGETADPDTGSSSSDPSTTDNPTGDTEASETDPSETDPSETDSSGSSDGSASSSGSSSDGVPGCDDDAQCDDSAPCTEDHCVAGACVSTDLDGVPAPESEQAAGDCQLVGCVAGEPSSAADDTDLPVDADDCTDDICTDGAPSHPATNVPMCLPEPVCDDGQDEDLDGNPDCLDSDCDGIAGCELGTEVTCDDFFDNDGDDDTDCADADCDGVGACEGGTELTCDDGLDNDADGNADCDDPDCNAVALCEFGIEITCGDGFDNDADGATDCLDGDCDGVGICQFGGELTCDDGFDNDGDGSTDCDDGDCDGTAACIAGEEIQCNDGVDNDSDGLMDGAEPNCGWVNTAMACPAGHAFGYGAIDLPQSIPSVGSSTRNSFIPVGLGATVAAVVVRINISHTYDSDLDITLLTPGLTSRELSTDNGGAGGSGDNFTNTVFSDSGPGVIGTAGFNDPPYASTYRPEQAFAPTLVGASTNGSWNLRVDDQFNLDGGTINTFQLGICTQ